MRQRALPRATVFVALVISQYHDVSVDAQALLFPPWATLSCGDTLTVSKGDLVNHGYPLFGDIAETGRVYLQWNFAYDPRWSISTCSDNTNFDTSLTIHKIDNSGFEPWLSSIFSADDDSTCSSNTSFAALTSEMPGASPLPTSGSAGVYYLTINGFVNLEDQVEVSIACGADSGLAEPLCGDCVEVKPEGETGCEIPAVEECVYGFDPYCEQYTWDVHCADIVYTKCTSMCPRGPTPAPTLGSEHRCDVSGFSDSRTDVYSHSCSHSSPSTCPSRRFFDRVCVFGNIHAIVKHTSCTQCAGECGNCGVERGEPGCDVDELEQCVCNLDAWCCEFEWDVQCVYWFNQNCAYDGCASE